MEYLNLMLCVMRLSTIFLPAQLRGPRPRKPTWCKGCYCQIIVHCKVIVEQHFTFIFFMFPNFTFGFVMFPSEKSNTSGLVPPAFTWGNSFSSLSAIHLQIHVTNLFVVWHRLPVKNIGHPFLWVLSFDTFWRSFTERKALPTEADTCDPDCSTGS